MSGGSFDYLCWKDSAEILQVENSLDSMAVSLTDFGDADDAAKETEEILAIIKHFRRRMDVRLDRLSGIWHAMEWYHSGDSSREGVHKALIAYREAIEISGNPVNMKTKCSMEKDTLTIETTGNVGL